MKLIKIVIRMPQYAAIALIRTYQRLNSLCRGRPTDSVSVTCPFYPSCSDYGREAIARFGLLSGGAFFGARLLRCHPWQKGGVDKVKN